MNEVFVVQNQLGQYWGKKKRWVDGSKPRKVHVCKHQDEGLNLLVELNSRDIDLRGEVLAVALSERGAPDVVPSEHLIADDDDLETFADVPSSNDELEPDASADSP
ncbi:MAG: hypothetical protein ABJ308_17440 [Halieaceae bacterium]